MNVRRAMLHTVLSRQAAAVIGAVSLMALARLVTPAEFGHYALAISIYVVFSTLADFGLKWRLVRAPNVDREEIGSAMGLSLLLSGLSAAALLAAAFFAPPALIGTELRATLQLLAGALILAPILLPLETGLERHLRFGLLSVLGAARAAIGAGVAIGLAFAGFGAAALAAGTLAERLTTLVGLLLFGERGSLPRPRLRGWRRFGRFGANLTITQLIPKIGDATLIAAFTGLGGAAAAGAFNRAERVVKLFDDHVLNGIKPVILPAFSRALESGVSPSKLYVAKVEHLSGISWPAFATIAVLAGPLVDVLLGSNWTFIVPIVQALALMGIAKPFTSMSLKFFVALDRSGQILRIHAAHQALRLALGIGGAMISLEAASLGIAAALWIKAAVLSRAVKRAIGYDTRALWLVIARGAAITAATVAGPVAVLVGMPQMNEVLQLLLGGATAGLGWLAGAALLRHPLLPEILLAVGAKRPAAWFRPAAL